jgi:hypothetical protein
MVAGGAGGSSIGTRRVASGLAQSKSGRRGAVSPGLSGQSGRFVVVNGAAGPAGAGVLVVLQSQLERTWSLVELVLEGLTDQECLWTPSESSYTVRRSSPDGVRVADWCEPEPWPAPPTSLGWLLWHTTWWWSMVINYSFGDATLQRCDVVWPGAAESLPVIRQLHDQWAELTGALGEEDLPRNSRTRWPYTDGRPFGHVLAG